MTTVGMTARRMLADSEDDQREQFNYSAAALTIAIVVRE